MERARGQWGRPVGQEIYYEVPTAAKLQMLNEIYAKYNRIDAGRDSVDIRWEQPYAGSQDGIGRWEGLRRLQAAEGLNG